MVVFARGRGRFRQSRRGPRSRCLIYRLVKIAENKISPRDLGAKVGVAERGPLAAFIGDRVHRRAPLAHVLVGANIVNKSRILYIQAENNRPGCRRGEISWRPGVLTLFSRGFRANQRFIVHFVQLRSTPLSKESFQE